MIRTAFLRMREPTPRQPGGWTVLGSFLVAFAAMLILTTVWGVAATIGGRAIGIPELPRHTLSRLGGLAILLVIFEAACRIVLGLRLSDLLRPAVRTHAADLITGIALGTLAMGVLYAIFRVAGWLIVEEWAWNTLTTEAWVFALWGALLSSLQAAIGEEIAFRGFFLTGLADAWGAWPALLAVSVPFAVIHLIVSTASQTNPIVFTVLLTLPSIGLGWMYLRGRSLWLVMGVHFAWNFVQGNLLDLSGGGGVYRFGAITSQTGPAWLVGTSYGVEVGALGLLALLIVIIGAWWWTRSHPLTQTGEAPN